MNIEDLRKYIDFTRTLLTEMKDKSEYSWFFESFKKEVVGEFFPNHMNSNDFDKFRIINESDVTRLKAYLNFIDKKAFNYGKTFYKDITDVKLRNELITDYKLMKIALKDDNIIEFGRRLSLQIENMLNKSLQNINVYDLIYSDKERFNNVLYRFGNNESKKDKEYNYNFYNSFFEQDKETKIYRAKELTLVPFKTKYVFLSIYFEFKVNSLNLDEIYFLRNKGSHRGELDSKETEKLNGIICKFDKTYSFYYKVLLDLLNGIKNL